MRLSQKMKKMKSTLHHINCRDEKKSDYRCNNIDEIVHHNDLLDSFFSFMRESKLRFTQENFSSNVESNVKNRKQLFCSPLIAKIKRLSKC